MHTNQSILDSSTGMSGLVTGSFKMPDRHWYCTIGSFQIAMFRMASVSLQFGSKDQVSRVQRVLSVGVMDGSFLVVLCAVRRWFVVFVRVFFVLRTVGLLHRRYK